MTVERTVFFTGSYIYICVRHSIVSCVEDTSIPRLLTRKFPSVMQAEGDKLLMQANTIACRSVTEIHTKTTAVCEQNERRLVITRFIANQLFQSRSPGK